MGEGPASAVIRNQLRTLAAGNPEEVLKNFASDAVLIEMFDPEDKRTGEALRESIFKYRGQYDDMTIEIQSIFDDGKMVCCECDIAGTRKDTGVYELVHYAVIAAVENGKLVLERSYCHPAKLADN
jgi:ketosteroid isomerase-like protein